MLNDSNRPDLDAFPRLERLLDAYAKQLTTGPRAEAVKLVDQAMPEIALALIAAAKTGGVMAIRLCFELAAHVPAAVNPWGALADDNDPPASVVQSPG